MSAGITMYSTAWCSDCKLAKRVFNELNISYTEIDIEQNPAARDEVMRLNNGGQSVPTIVFPDGSILVEPTAAILKAKVASL
jgi:mycoredoxin